MELPDLAPPAVPTRDQQRDALRKGLGRAHLWAEAGRLDDGPLLEACLSDLRYDTQLDDARGDWLWALIQAAGAADRLRAPILAALTALDDERSASQLCTLAYHFAAAGDGRFHDRLRAIVITRPYPESYLLGEGQVVRLDGAAGFLFVARVRGEQLVGRAWDDGGWHDTSFVWHSGEALGEEVIARLLNEATDPALVRFARAWQVHQAGEEERKRGREGRPRPWDRPVEEVLRDAAAEERFWRLSGWGLRASEADLRLVADRLRATGDPVEVKNLLYVFGRIAVPDFDPKLLDLCGHADPELRRRAFLACGLVAHPAVRARGLAELARGVELKGAVGLLVRNFEPGDEDRVLAALQVLEDVDEWHWLLMEAIDLLGTNAEADPSALGLVAYALTPCTNCRRDAVQVLLDRDAAPAWLLAECRHDSDESIRELVAAVPPTAAGTDDAEIASK